mgnify:CR=1 FL=1
MTINGATLAGVKPGSKFRESLYAPLEMKDYIYNESRLEHGRRVLSTTPRYKSRSLTLEFTITAASSADLVTRTNALYSALYAGDVAIAPTEYGTEVFHLIYTGKSPTYDHGTYACKVKVGFDEPDPSNRV